MKFSHRTGEKRSSFPSSVSSMTGTQAGSSFCPPIPSTLLVFSEAAQRLSVPSTAGSQLHWGRAAEIQRQVTLVHFHVEKLHSWCRKVTNGARFSYHFHPSSVFGSFLIISFQFAQVLPIHVDRNLVALQQALLASGVPSFRDIPLSVQANGDRAQGVLISAINAVGLASVRSTRARARRKVVRVIALQLHFQMICSLMYS